MVYSFKNILIPIDNSINTEVAVSKGLELAVEGTIIHLLYVEPNKSFWSHLTKKRSGKHRKTSGNNMFALDLWKKKIEESGRDISVCAWTMAGHTVQNAIIKKARQLAVDLVIIGKSSHHSWLPFLNTVVLNNIVEETGITVLTVKPGSLNNRTRIVVVPLAGETAYHKMEVILAICRKFHVTIHLITFTEANEQPDEFDPSSLLQMYQWLKTTTHCTVEYAVLSGHNKARAILDYARKIDADILLVHPKTETKIGWLNTHISDVLPPSSKVQVLTVQPATTLSD